MKPYKLMTSLFGHTGDVKSLSVTRDPGGFVSVSRDLTAKLWLAQTADASNQYIQAQTITAHKKYVNAVAVLYSLPEYPNGVILTGSNDMLICIHDIESNADIAQLKEHEGAVCTLFCDNSSGKNLLYSGSFDSSAKVWDLSDLVKSDFKLQSILTIKEHTHTVWGVLAIESRQILLTASADKTIKQFGINADKKTYDFQVKYSGHADCVRGLCLNPHNANEFFSCSNDGTVMQWQLGSANAMRTIPITGSFLYSINALRLVEGGDPDACYVITSGEDRSLRVHKIGARSAELAQCVTLPCQTLWYTVELSNGAVGVACCDGSIRLFTQKEEMMATKSELESYSKELASFSISTKTDEKLAEIKLNDLPGLDALERPGRKDGQSIIVNNNNEAEVYQWEASESRWVKIGVAVGSSESGGSSKKTNYLGKDYDYVFDIELDDTKSSLKLPYNVSEDPYHAAQKFIHDNELSQLFLDQIAQFLVRNTQSQTIGDSAVGRSYYDPFTGENRYMPSSSNVATSGGYADPFTGSSAYTSGSGNGVAQQSAAPPKPSNEYYPHLDFILFDQTKAELVLNKAKEFQQQHQSSGDLTKIENLIANMEKITSDADFQNEVESLLNMLQTWPTECRFPLIDLLRILALHSQVAAFLTSSNTRVQLLLSLVTPHSPVNSSLVAKVFCNVFKSFATQPKIALFLLAERQTLLKHFSELNSSENKNIQIAFASLLLNFVVLVKKLAASPLADFGIEASALGEVVIELVQYFNELATSVLHWDGEALFRVLVAFGTLVSKTKESCFDNEFVVTVAKSLDGVKLACQEINAKAQKFPEKVASCAKYLINEFN